MNATPTTGQKNALVPLSVMMFLQFFVWGAWYVSMTGFINRSGMAGVTGAAYSVGPIAAIISPFFLGLIADRFFATQRVLGTLHVLGGALICLAPMVAKPFNGDTDGSPFLHPFILVLLLHMLCYMPTLGLTSSIAFHNLSNREKQFPIVRVCGTIGWIAGNWAVAALPGKDQSAEQFYLTGAAAIILGVFSFMALPHTPPPAKGKAVTAREIMGLDSLSLLAKPAYLVFIICSFLLCIPLAGYYAQARNFVDATGTTVAGSGVLTMSFGQMSEIFFMLIMPLCFARLGVKWMLAVGMLAWVVRYGLFAGAWDASGANHHITSMVLGGIILHGICYDFFFVTGMIYVDQAANKEIRSQAQGFLVFVTQGLGMFIGAMAFDWWVKRHSAGTVQDWKGIWTAPAIMAGVIFLLFVVLFRSPKKAATIGSA
ncbi:MAG: MFS transporter [Phycisphaerales bacterium]